MFRKFALVPAFLALAFGVAAAPLAAQGAASDVRCLLVSNIFAKNDKNAQAKQVASNAMLFYGGRVTALPNGQAQAAIAAEAKQITPANAAPTMTACAQRMSRSLQALQALGAKMQQPKR